MSPPRSLCYNYQITMSIILEVKAKIKWLVRKVGEPDIFTALVVILVAFLSFGLGRLSVISSQKQEIRLETIPAGQAGNVGAAATVAVTTTKPPSVVDTTKGQFVASKNGTRYYLPWCSGATRIKEGNRVWFQTAEEAKRAGYEPSSTCKGL